MLRPVHRRAETILASVSLGRYREACQEAELKNAIDAAQRSLALPHSEDVLALLLNVHMVGGTKDLVEHLEGAAMRTEVVLSLSSQLRDSGYPGYTDECNSDAAAAVRSRVNELYES